MGHIATIITLITLPWCKWFYAALAFDILWCHDYCLFMSWFKLNHWVKQV